MESFKKVRYYSLKQILPIILCLGLLSIRIDSMAEDNTSYDIFQKFFAAGRLNRCIELLKQVDPKQTNVRYQYLIALANFCRDHYEEAINDIDKTLSSCKDIDSKSKGDLLALRGASYYEMASYKKALEDFTSALKLMPQSYEIAKSQAQTYEKLGNHNKATEISFPQGTVSFQDRLLLSRWHSYGVPMMEIIPLDKFPGQGNIEKWKEAVKLAEQARVLESKDQLDKAIEMYKRASELYSYSPAIYAALGLCYTTRKDYGDRSDSIAAFKKALALDSSDWRIWNDFGSVLFNSEGSERSPGDTTEYKEARHAFEIALSKGKDSDQMRMQKEAIARSLVFEKEVSSLDKQFKELESSGQIKFIPEPTGPNGYYISPVPLQ